MSFVVHDKKNNHYRLCCTLDYFNAGFIKCICLICKYYRIFSIDGFSTACFLETFRPSSLEADLSK